MLEQTMQEIKDALAANGGKMLYPDLLESVPPLHRQYIPNALQALRATGDAHQVVAFDASTSRVSHSVIAGAPANA